MKKPRLHTFPHRLLESALLLATLWACTPDEEETVLQASCNRVWAYMPAPGQFINEGYSLTTMDEACAWAKERLEQGLYVSLGAFGGYIVVGFDHAVVNDGSYNLSIKGNAYDGNSEPGIVWVMSDTNGNGKPDDTWYELRGSDADSASTWHDYEVTYHRPSEPNQPVRWSDNHAQEGYVDYLAAYHHQDTYYPLWAEADSLVLKGTRLAPHSYDASGNGTLWINESFAWGYADNYSAEDLFADPDGMKCNHFRISDAVDEKGSPIRLDSIHFVKVQTAVLAQCGWIGEVSTEVIAIRDYNLLKKK